MSTDTRPGGFTGDPAEAFSPPAASGCCGGAFTPTATSSSGCCGSASATASDAAHEENADASGCCG